MTLSRLIWEDECCTLNFYRTCVCWAVPSDAAAWVLPVPEKAETVTSTELINRKHNQCHFFSTSCVPELSMHALIYIIT